MWPIILSVLVGMIIWQGMTLILFLTANEKKCVYILSGVWLFPLYITKQLIKIIKKLKLIYFKKNYIRLYFYIYEDNKFRWHHSIYTKKENIKYFYIRNEDSEKKYRNCVEVHNFDREEGLPSKNKILTTRQIKNGTEFLKTFYIE